MRVTDSNDKGRSGREQTGRRGDQDPAKARGQCLCLPMVLCSGMCCPLQLTHRALSSNSAWTEHQERLVALAMLLLLF